MAHIARQSVFGGLPTSDIPSQTRCVARLPGGRINPSAIAPTWRLARHLGTLLGARNFRNHSPDQQPRGDLQAHAKALPAFSKSNPHHARAGRDSIAFRQWSFDIVPVPPFRARSEGEIRIRNMFFWPIDHEHTEIRIQRYAYKAECAEDRVAQGIQSERARSVTGDLATMEASLAEISLGALTHIVPLPAGGC